MNAIEKLYKEWLSLQPVTEEIQARIDRKFILEFNYNSNHIEGNTLTYGQTELLLLFDKVDGNAKMQDLEEMKAHNVCLKMMQTEAADKERPLTEAFVRKLHETLLREDYTVYKTLKDGTQTSYVVHAGVYKTRPNSVITATGERFEYASPEETPALMTSLVKWYNDAVEEGNMSILELASLFHYRYIRIHPFEDGNGRIARLLVNFILLRGGYPMIIVRSNDKDNYLNALNSSDINVGLIPSDGANAELEQIQPFTEYMQMCVERALTIRIKAAKGENIEEDDDIKKRIALIKKQAVNKKIEKSTAGVRECRRAFYDLCKHFEESISELKTMFDSYSLSYERPKLVEKEQSFIEKINLTPKPKEYTKPETFISFKNLYYNRRMVPVNFDLTEEEVIFNFKNYLYAGDNVFSKEVSIKIEFLSKNCLLSSNIEGVDSLEVGYSEFDVIELGKPYVNTLCNKILDEIERTAKATK